MRARLTITLLLTMPTLTGCQDIAFDPPSYLVGLRLLAVKADPPEVAPGAQSQLAALVYNADAEAGAVEILWDACHLAPPANTGVAEDCIVNAEAPYLEPLGQGPSAIVTMPDLPYTEAVNRFGLPDYTGGFYLPVRLRASAGEVSDTGIYKLRYGLPFQPPNRNPTLTGVYVVEDLDDAGVPGDAGSDIDDAGRPLPDDGGTAIVFDGDGGSRPVRLRPLDDEHPLSLAAGEKVTLRVGYAPGSAETYYTFEGNPLSESSVTPVEVTEILRALWYAPAGSFSRNNTGTVKQDNVFSLDKHVPEPGTSIDLIVVAHEERGGTDWIRRTIQVR